MKVRRHLFERMDRLEIELREALVPALRRAAAGGDSLLFLAAETNPYPGMHRFVRRAFAGAGEGLLGRAHEILALAAQLGEATDALLAHRVVHYFERAFESATGRAPHEKGTARLAKEWLRELGEQDS